MISGMAFLPTLFQLFGWNKNGRYKLIGSVHRKDEESVLLFSAKDAVLFVEEAFLNSESTEDQKSEYGSDGNAPPKRAKKVKAYPASWARSFGEKYYSSFADQQATEPKDEAWMISASGMPFIEKDSGITSQKEAAAEIQKLLTEMGVSDD